MAALNTFSPRYNWIYGHGEALWQMSDDQQRKYRQGKHGARSGPIVPAAPTVPNLNAYFSIIARPGLAVRR